jgi:hypothetical protein
MAILWFAKHRFSSALVMLFLQWAKYETDQGGRRERHHSDPNLCQQFFCSI